jgi:Ca2+-binding RTX toxin-like protein
MLRIAPVAGACLVLVGVTGSGWASSATTCGDIPATIVGTEGDDTLTGTPTDDVFQAAGGNDTIDGGGGGDLICGGAGNDVVVGGPGDDGLSGDAGDDRIDGSPGYDFAFYDDSPAAVVVDLLGGTATGGDGADTLTAVEAVFGSNFDDRLSGDDDVNSLEGGPGADVLAGRGGDDFISGSEGNDRFIGGPGEDTAYYNFSPRAIRASLATRVGTGWGRDTFRGIEDVNGSARGDVLVGDAGRNWIIGYAGNDVIRGGAGNDRLEGGKGKDTVDGGPGRDRCLTAEKKIRCP